MVASAGEIGIRAPGGARAVGIPTVGVFTVEDRMALHRRKVDEAFQIGEAGHPVRGYLDVAAIVGAAVDSGCDAVYPGYGFLSESAQLAQACADAGLTFVGPSPRVLALAGDN